MSAEASALLALPPGAGAHEIAAAAAARIAVVAGAGGAVRPAGARRMVAGPEAYAALVAEAVGGRVVAGTAFGGAWPLAELEEGLAGPGVPVLAREAWREGPDGAYRRQGAAVEREGADGPSRLWAAGRAAGGRPPELLLFEPAARWMVREGTVQVEDAFSRVEARPPAARLEALLSRRLGVPAAVASRVAAGASPGASWLTVWREAELVGEGWRDPARLLSVREGVSARARGGRVAVRTPRGEAELEVETCAGGWRARRLRGWFPAERIEARPERGRIAYRWELSAGLDPLEDAVRLRLAFDLASDLVVVGRPTS